MVDLKSLVPWRNSSAAAPAMRGDFFDPLVNFRREVNRMFDDFFEGAGWSGPGHTGMMPAVDVHEDEKELVVTAELPGVNEKDIEVSLAGDVLTIKGEKKAEREHKNGESWRMERHYGSFERAIELPFDVKDSQVDAKFTNGVLSVRIPKPADLQHSTRKIEVKAG
ncbi:MAG: Hsp20/alpha crystallin family protein [Proteobacteria bacterium]|nr:Hsp20/alpha crystallin family protein [Pseudomonadota bacterium]